MDFVPTSKYELYHEYYTQKRYILVVGVIIILLI